MCIKSYKNKENQEEKVLELEIKMFTISYIDL